MAVGYVDFRAKMNKGKKGKGGQNRGGGLYAGKAGSFAAQQNPQGFVNANLLRGGLISGTGPAAYEDWLQNDYFNSLMTGYEGALSGNERLKFDKFFRGTTGAADIGKRKPSKMPGYEDFRKLRMHANNLYNVQTPYQRGVTFNPFTAGMGRTSYWD
jgi:hypothetical protein